MPDQNPVAKDEPQKFLLLAGIIIGLLIAGWVGFLLGFDQPTKAAPPIPSYTEGLKETAPKADALLARGQTRRPCVNVSSETQSDLCAQWTAALAAVRSANETSRATNWAILGIAVGCLTVIGLLVTIRQTAGSIAEAREGNQIAAAANDEARRRAIDDAADTARAIAAAERNAVASDKQAEAAISTAHNQLRAYLHMRQIAVSDFGDKTPLVINFHAINYGETPAHKIQLYLSTGVVMFGDPVDLPEPILMERYSGAPVAKGHFYTTQDIPFRMWLDKQQTFEQEILRMLKAGEAVFHIRGRIEYLDIFGILHASHFHVVMGGPTEMKMTKQVEMGDKVYAVGYWPTGNDAD